jgi:hypothetical protein
MNKLAMAVVCLVALAAVPAAADEWEYDLALYGWLAGLDESRWDSASSSGGTK